MRMFFLAAPLFLVACGDLSGACEDYVAAANTCNDEYVEAAGGTATPVSDSFCDAYDGVKDQASADYLQCLTDAYNNGDCSTTEGYTAVATELGSCTAA
jgi:hypothetical protein